MRKTIIVLAVFCIFNLQQGRSQTTNIRLFAFGHSLIDHRPPLIPTPSDETTIIHWIHDIAEEAGYLFAAGGKYGFLPQHDDLPPFSQWGYDNVPGVWESDTEPFSQADINTVLITAGNFIQYQPPNLPHPIDENTTVVQATETIFDWVNEQESDVRFYIYANWPEMDLPEAYPPTVPPQSEIDKFHQQTLGAFAEWWIDYQNFMLASRPALNTRLIPVGPIISKILTQVIPNEIPFTELYEDSAPHGRANIYFLAGMITYMAIYEENIPMSYMPNDIIHLSIRENLAEIRTFIWDELHNFNDEDGMSRVFFSPTTNIDSKPYTHTLNIHPNPAQGWIEISGLKRHTHLELFNLQGQKVLTQKDINSSIVNLDIQSLSKGVYFLRIVSLNEDSDQVIKLVKNE